MSIDLAKLSLAELKALQSNIAKAIASFENRRRSEALAAMEATAKEHGFALSELLGAATTPRKRMAARAKYAHPENASVTWTGRGRKPLWVAAALSSGRKLEDLLI
jgi:DNA-binding protein H-NS